MDPDYILNHNDTTVDQKYFTRTIELLDEHIRISILYKNIKENEIINVSNETSESSVESKEQFVGYCIDMGSTRNIIGEPKLKAYKNSMT